MSENPDFLPEESPKEEFPPVKSWYMVTNQINLYYMVAAGMIMPPAGFGRKYYQDTVAAFPGYLPIFPECVSQAAVEYSVVEKTHLLPCIMNLELSNLSGEVKVIDANGEVKDVNFPEAVDSSCQLMLVPAPLPITWVKTVICRSREDKTRCEKDAADFSNVDLSNYPIKSTAGAFSKQKNQTWPPPNITIDPGDTELGLPMAAGAMMGLLLNMSRRGELSILTGKLVFKPEKPLKELASYPEISAMGEWLEQGGSISTNDVSPNLFWDIVSRVSQSTYSLERANAIDVAIDYLETMPSEQFNEKTRSYGERLAADLRDIAGFADSTITEIFERHPKPVSRAMTLFVLREKIGDLLEFKNPKLTEADYILAAILFAAREGWIGLSKELREFPGLNSAVSHRMAAMSHRISASNIDLGIPPARPQSLIELLSSDSGLLSKRQNEAALYIARELKWDCIQTRIKLGKGDYQLAVSSSGVELALDGDVRAVVTEVLLEKLMDKLRISEIPAKLDRKVREILKVAS